MVDLRSDTGTLPTEAMRRAMSLADVGNDAYGEDPTVNRLEELAAAKVGKEAAVFVPSGTMGNLVAILAQAQRGDEILVEASSHVISNGPHCFAVLTELGGMTIRPIVGIRGQFPPTALGLAAQEAGRSGHRARMVCIENTHNGGGGSVWPLATLCEVVQAGRAYGLVVHMDGARIFNAAIALGLTASEICRPVDSVMFCLSKGLAAPVGSLVCGTRDVTTRARHWRKILGGGMRQAGILAAAGIVALNQMVDRLVDDHANAQLLAEGLSNIGPFCVAPVETNIVMLDISRTALDASQFIALLRPRGVLCGPRDAHTVRLVTHKDIDKNSVQVALNAFHQVVKHEASGRAGSGA